MFSHEDLAFKPYIYMWIDQRGERYAWNLISLTLNSHVIQLTNYHIYIGDKKKTKKLTMQNRDDVRRVCNFLNYVLFEHFWQYKSNNIASIPFKAVQAYLKKYATTKNRFDDYPSAQSVEKERSAVCHFMANLSTFRKDKRDHYYARQLKSKKSRGDNVLRVRKRNEHTYWDYEIQAEYIGGHEYNLIRDIPQKAIPVILRWIQLKAPDIYFAAVLQLCAGLREGEVVNVRRADSKYYNGINYTKENGKFTSFEIDLTREYLLRSDGKDIGHIKRKRTQLVYPIFLPVVQQAYETHLRLIKRTEIEDESPMFVTNYINKATGKRMALTKHAYCNRVINIVEKYVIPELLTSDDTELKVFAMTMNEGNWGVHAFRHWYTVQLVLNNEDANSIAFLRGDISTKSAFTYIQNKGELMKQYTKVSNLISDDLIQVISEMKDVQR